MREVPGSNPGVALILQLLINWCILNLVSTVDEPIDLILHSLKEKVYVKCRHGRELKGTLLCYDEHLNLMLSDVEEKITTMETDPLTK